MTYECRNGVKTGSSSYAMIHCDISSTSSDDEDVRMLRELKGISRGGALKIPLQEQHCEGAFHL